jgi:hypothetical protein
MWTRWDPHQASWRRAAHRRPRGHDTSLIQRSTHSTNQEQAHGSKGPQPQDNGLETMQTLHTHLGAHLAVTWTKTDMIGVTPGSADPLGRPNPL